MKLENSEEKRILKNKPKSQLKDNYDPVTHHTQINNKKKFQQTKKII